MPFFALSARSRPLLRALATLLLGGLAPLASAHAQTPPHAKAPPFSTVWLQASGNAPVYKDLLDTYYRSFPGAAVSATTPFYAGAVGMEGGLRRYLARDGQAREDLWAVPIALHWGVRPSLRAGRLRLEGSVLLGALFMRFSDGLPGLQSESELLVGAEAGLSWRIGGRWRIAAGARYEHVFTSTPIRLGHVHLGIRRRFDAPDWFQTFFR